MEFDGALYSSSFTKAAEESIFMHILGNQLRKYELLMALTEMSYVNYQYITQKKSITN